MSIYDYPLARKDIAIEDNFHGLKVKDGFRWLEDPAKPETQEFIELQNKLSEQFLKNGKQWKQFHAQLTQLWNYPKYSIPLKYGNYCYFYRNSGLQNQSVLYQQDRLDSKPRVFFDPNTLSEDGTIALSQTAFSGCGKYFAYGLSENGSDWMKIKIRDVKTGKDFNEILENVKFSNITWTKDCKGFFYGRYSNQDGKTECSETKQNESFKLFYHRIGESQEKDIIVVDFLDEPSWCIQSYISECNKYLILPVSKDCSRNILFYANLETANGITSKLNLINIINKFDSIYEYITNIGSRGYFRSNKNAPNYRVIIIDFNNPAEGNWITIIPEHEKDVLDWAICVNADKILLFYIHDVKTVLQVNSLISGKFIRNFDLDIGTVSSISYSRKYSEIYYSVTSFLNPGTIYHYDFNKPNENPKLFREIGPNLNRFRKEKYKVEQVFYNSKDGTKIPMFIIRKNNAVSPRPCLLLGYGGFNVSLQPTFSINALMFINTLDGVVAYPNIRGGGEYGAKWHNGGRLLNKQNSFDDFQASAQYLLDNNYTTKDRLVIRGGSNGGLLVAACINQRPDLFGAAVMEVGVMDMLRFHKFTIGRGWCSEYGNPSDKNDFQNLYKYSPLHNVRTPKNSLEEYPSTLILTADHDDRVCPLHSLKFVAALQDAVKKSEFQRKPILLKVYSKVGHGAGKSTSKYIEEATDILTFMYKTLNTKLVKLHSKRKAFNHK